MKVLVIDGQGGNVGRQLVRLITEKIPQAQVLAIGTNSIATANMLKGGAQHASTGENAIVVACRNTDYIVGPIGLIVADSLYGQVTPRMAFSVAKSQAKRILIPMNRCDTLIAGVGNIPLSELLQDAVRRIVEME